MQLQESGQMYLETILILTRRTDFVRAIDIGEHMGYSKPSVSRAVGVLREGGYITVARDGAISLTPVGRELAEKIYERHKTLTQFFEQIGVDQKTALEDACKVEHYISDLTFERIKAFTKQNHT